MTNQLTPTTQTPVSANQVIGQFRSMDIVVRPEDVASYNKLLDFIGAFEGFDGLKELGGTISYMGMASPFLLVNIEEGYPDALGMLNAVVAMYDLKLSKVFPSILGGVTARIYANSDDIPVDLKPKETSTTKYIDPTKDI